MPCEKYNNPIPPAFQSRDNTRNSITHGLNIPERSQLINALAWLESSELQSAIDKGFITLGAIKPYANKGTNLPDNDQEAAHNLISEIDGINGLSVIFQVSFQLSRDQAEEFYDGQKSQTYFNDLVEFMSSGPTTFLLICDPEQKAVEKFRNLIGRTLPDGNQSTIRGRHAIASNMPNNLVHGSESTEAVKTEVKKLVNFLSGYTI